MNLIITLIIAGIAGWLAGLITKNSGFGIFGNILVGIIGGLLGNFLFSLLGLGDSNFIGQLIISVIGSVVLVYILSFFRKI